MSNASAYAELDAIRRKLGALASDRVRLQIHNAIAHETVALIGETFERQQSPYGIAWPARKRSYPWPILRKSGRLARSLLKFRLTVRGFSISTRLPYADTHQYGRGQGRGRIPARPYMPEPRTNPVLPKSWQRAYDDAAETVVHSYIT